MSRTDRGPSRSWLSRMPSGNNKEARLVESCYRPSKAIDTNKFCRLPNVLGACQGSTGPTSPKADGSGEKYGADFPDFSIGDMVGARKNFSMS